MKKQWLLPPGFLRHRANTVTSLSVCHVICNISTAEVWPLRLVVATARHGLVTEAVVEDKKEHLLRAKGNEDGVYFYAYTFSKLAVVEQDNLLFRLF